MLIEKPYLLEHRFEKVFILKLLKESRERLVLRMISIEMLVLTKCDVHYEGEVHLLTTEIDLVSRIMNGIHESVLANGINGQPE